MIAVTVLTSMNADDLAGIAGWLDRDANERDRWLAEERQVAVENLSFERMAARLESLLSEAGWMP